MRRWRWARPPRRWSCWSYEFALLISDIGLPDGDGWELLRQVRQRWPVRALAVSAYNAPEDLEKSRAVGFEAHLAKPVDLNQLAQYVARVSEEIAQPQGANAAPARPANRMGSPSNH